jgi:hypothetical protein
MVVGGPPLARGGDAAALIGGDVGGGALAVAAQLHIETIFGRGLLHFSFKRESHARLTRREPWVNLGSTWGKPAPSYLARVQSCAERRPCILWVLIPRRRRFISGRLEQPLQRFEMTGQ